MALLSSSFVLSSARIDDLSLQQLNLNYKDSRKRSFNLVALKESSSSSEKNMKMKLEIGTPIVVTEAPKMIKTSASIPCLRVNSGFVNPGDVGRIVSRKPKDVWAVRLSIGTYLIDAKYFKPLDINQ